MFHSSGASFNPFHRWRRNRFSAGQCSYIRHRFWTLFEDLPSFGKHRRSGSIIYWTSYTGTGYRLHHGHRNAGAVNCHGHWPVAWRCVIATWVSFDRVCNQFVESICIQVICLVSLAWVTGGYLARLRKCSGKGPRDDGRCELVDLDSGDHITTQVPSLCGCTWAKDHHSDAFQIVW